MPITSYFLAAALLPLLSTLLLLFFGKRLNRFAAILATTLLAGSLALSVGALILWVAKPGFNQPQYVEAFTYRWLPLPSASANPAEPAAEPAITLGVVVDSLTVALFILTSFLGTLIHLFSLGTIDPKSQPRFFALLNLLLFASFGLFLANSLIQLIIFWQILGIATWLLINFDQHLRLPVAASLRTFLFHRLGDAALLTALGILLAQAARSNPTQTFPNLSLFDDHGTSVLTATVANIAGINSSEFLLANGGFLGFHWLTWVGILFLIAALTRAAQFPFFTSITNTPQSPPPASALIQTCTTLAASLYLIARIYPILTLDARLIMAILGAVSLCLCALIACAQSDLRHVLAYTSAGQFGYMFLFLGCGDYSSGLLTLFTHAFIKSALLLSAASLAHSIGDKIKDPHNLDNLGGLWKRLPITAAASLLATLALAGTPYLAGSYSANLGLASVYSYASALSPASTFSPHMLLFWIPLVSTALTAFAIGRWWCLIFIAPPPDPASYPRALKPEDIHESAPLTLPIIVLASFCFGILFDFSGIRTFIEKSLPLAAAPFATRFSPDNLQAVATLSILAPAGAVLAFLLFFKGPRLAHRLTHLPGLNLLHLTLKEQLFFPPFYDLLATLTLSLANLTNIIDRYLLAPALRLLAFAIEALAHLLARMDTLLDLPAKKYALLLALKLHRLLSPPPPPPEP